MNSFCGLEMTTHQLLTNQGKGLPSSYQMFLPGITQILDLINYTAFRGKETPFSNL
jgi:hypothetical protein